RGFSQRDDRRERELREPPPPLPEITVTFLPDERGVESLARQIKMTGRAFPLFQIAQIVLAKPERYSVQLSGKKKVAQASPPVRSEETHGQDARATTAIVQPLFVCALDDTPWLSEDDAVAHVLRNHFATFYQAERTAIEPPKGKYTFVAQCGMSGVILGPPNHHDYQNQLRKLHTERFSRMPFEVFKARIKIVRDEAVVKKWVEEQSFRTEYICLNVPEPLKLPSREEVEKHFRAVHKDAIIKPAESHTIGGVLSRNLRCRELQRLVRNDWERQKYFPLQLATGLSRRFTTHGLHFFKVNRTFTHVSVARPQFLDLETTPVSESIRRIVGHINAHPKCTRRQLIEALAPTPIVAQASPPVQSEETHGQDARATTEAAAPAKPAEPQAPEPTSEQTAVIADLHWLVHQGHVIEFADGRMDTAKKPAPRPPTQAAPEASPRREPEKKATGEKPAAEGEAAATMIEPSSEIPVLTEAEIPASEPEPAVEPVSEVPPPADAPVPATEPAAEAAVETPPSVESAAAAPVDELAAGAPASESAPAVETAPAEPGATPAIEPAPAPATEPAAEDNPSPS
ncbi:MAG: hypothetical protein WBW41_08125, partial [Verrucomicrobiia bacterium]